MSKLNLTERVNKFKTNFEIAYLSYEFGRAFIKELHKTLESFDYKSYSVMGKLELNIADHLAKADFSSKHRENFFLEMSKKPHALKIIKNLSDDEINIKSEQLLPYFSWFLGILSRPYHIAATLYLSTSDPKKLTLYPN